jgi:PhzF family phenazine biosynthesis protein
LDSTETVRQLSPDHLALKQWGIKVGVAAITSHEEADSGLLISRSNRESRAFVGRTSNAHASLMANKEPHLEVRAFAAAVGITEDPVTGSLNASLAQWLIGSGTLPAPYLASQGQALGRQGRVYIQQDSQGQVWVGGDTVVCIEGHVALD